MWDFFHNKLILNFWKIYCTIKTFYSELFTVNSFWMSVFVFQLGRRTIPEANRKLNSTLAVLALFWNEWMHKFFEKDLTTVCCIYPLIINVHYQIPKNPSELQSFMPRPPSFLLLQVFFVLYLNEKVNTLPFLQLTTVIHICYSSSLFP